MLKHIEDIIEYNSELFKRDIDDYIEYLYKIKNTELKNIKKINNKNIFYNKENNTFADFFLELFNIYKLSQKKGGKYFLTNNIAHIEYLYSKILTLSELVEIPSFIKSQLKENIKSFKLNKKINVFKDIEYVKVFFVEKNIFLKEDFNEFNIEYIIKEDKHLLNIFDLNYEKLIKNNNLLLELLLSRNVTTIHNRYEYNLKPALIRMKKDFQLELMNFLYLNNSNFKNEKDVEFIIHSIERFSIAFGSKILINYINDFIYYLHNYKQIHKVEILSEIQNLLLELEISILEDYYIICEDNNELYHFIKNYLILLFKRGMVGKNEENLYIETGKIKGEIREFFSYRIYY